MRDSGLACKRGRFEGMVRLGREKNEVRCEDQSWRWIKDGDVFTMEGKDLCCLRKQQLGEAQQNAPY